MKKYDTPEMICVYLSEAEVVRTIVAVSSESADPASHERYSKLVGLGI